ncbi:MAG: hypothetical protein IT204_06020 [Fimbriimonadaceae bacterium]|nr:hypothetical protein [Fimbriimonadaceae bacterium]
MRSTLDCTAGAPRLRVDGRLVTPLTFRSFRPQQRYVEEFSQLGVRIVNCQVSGNLCSLGVPYNLYGPVWTGPRQYDDGPLHRQMADLQAWSGGRYVLQMIDLNPPAWWLAAHPDQADPFVELAEMASSTAWRTDAADYLRHLLTVCERDWGEQIIGYALLGGRTHEWFCSQDERDTPLKVAAAAAALGAPWPSRDERLATADGQFRDPLQQAAAIAAWRWHSQQIADLLLHFAATAQEVVQHRKLLGSFFGYLLQFGSGQLLWGGHAAAQRVFGSPDLDFYLCPANYNHRRSDQVSSFMMPVDSLRAHGKLALLEFDHITPTALEQVDGHLIPGQGSKLATVDEAAGVMARDACLALAKGHGLWWFDMFGGWFDHDRFRAVVDQTQRAAEELLAAPYCSVAELAVAVDPDSIALVDGRGSLLRDLLCGQVDGLGRGGAPYDIYLLDDLLDPARDTSRYRLLLFLNCFRDTPALRRAVARLQPGRTLVWLHAAGYAGPDGLAVAGCRALTGLPLERVASVQSVTVGDRRYGFGQPQSPGLLVSGAAALEVLGRTPDGRPGLVRQAVEGGAVVHSAVGPLPGWLLRELAGAAGVHGWVDDDQPLYVSNQVLGLHSPTGGVRRVRLPGPERLRPLLASRPGGLADLPTLLAQPVSGGWEVAVELLPWEARLFAREPA